MQSDEDSAMAATASPAPGVRERSRRWTSVFLGLCCLLVYNANRRAIAAGDTFPARYLPFAIVQHGTLFLDPVAQLTAQGRGGSAFWMVPRPDGHVISLYPVVVPVLVAPLYLPAVAYLRLAGWSDARLDYVARVMEKLSASLVAALSVSLLYLLLRRRTRESVALLLTAAYACGTTTWVISSQALWQHGVGALLVVAVLLLITGPPTLLRVLATGLFCGLLAANRPPDAILAAALGSFALFWAGRRRPGSVGPVGSPAWAAWLLAAAALPVAALLLYNFGAAGNFLGGYGLIGKARFFSHDLLAGIAGLLFSPTRGLAVFSPFLLFLVLVPRRLPRSRDERFLTAAMIAAAALQIVLYAKADWRGGLSWGPRYMTSLLPFFIWMLEPVVSALRGAARLGFLAAVGAAIAIETIGAFFYTPAVDIPIFAGDRGAEYHDMRGAWRWRNASFVTSLQQGLAPADLATTVRGSFDHIEVAGRAEIAATAGQEVVAAGWALAGPATPAQVAVILDGRPFATATFLDRPDVRAALREASPAGWRIAIDTTGMAPGEHSLTAFVWTTAKGEGQYLQQRTLTLRAASGALAGTSSPVASETAAAADIDLRESATRAAARIREHQQAEGDWLTAYTNGTRFREPRPEANTFLTALLVDLLAPLPGHDGLTESLQRARRHLTAQIEAGGLVRYHGRPDSPRIGTLGCAITPDTDDTALVWRVAPGPDRGLLAAALATIDRYRRPDGLYRSWLAAREDYQCLDPGSDPNPADVAIQMHLFLLLAEARPPASRALCEALRSHLDADRIWVYYRGMPLVPILRLADLRAAGCDLQLPEARMRTTVPGQGIWVSAARWLAPSDLAKVPPPDPVLLRGALREIARDDFALLRTDPPLLYHNDLTATVARYYWSQDVGFALWLRLYDRYGHLAERRLGQEVDFPALRLDPALAGPPRSPGRATDGSRFRDWASGSARLEPDGAPPDRQRVPAGPRFPA